jgi:hypothetical protein
VHLKLIYLGIATVAHVNAVWGLADQGWRSRHIPHTYLLFRNLSSGIESYIRDGLINACFISNCSVNNLKGKRYRKPEMSDIFITSYADKIYILLT